MQYMGGKSRIAKYIAAEINKVRKPGQLVWDAFCGGLSVSVALSKHGPVLSTDANAALINLYKAVQNGWEPPTEVSKETWTAAKSLPDTDPMKAFCGFGCSWGGIWFSGFVESHRSRVCKRGVSAGMFSQQWPHSACATGLVRDCPGKRFECFDFLQETPRCVAPVIYLDPPYKDTTGYKSVGDFDHDRFCCRLKEWCLFSDVFVSEYSLPIGVLVWSKDKPHKLTGKLTDGTGKTRATERLYHLPKGSTW